MVLNIAMTTGSIASENGAIFMGEMQYQIYTAIKLNIFFLQLWVWNEIYTGSIARRSRGSDAFPCDFQFASSNHLTNAYVQVAERCQSYQ